MTEPVEILRAAAAKLREMADDLGDWWHDEKLGYVRDSNGDLVAEVCGNEGRWIAKMGPGKAGILAQWLDGEASHVDGYASSCGEEHDPFGKPVSPEMITGNIERFFPIPLAFARSILEDK
jgi:hypothetical protein